MFSEKFYATLLEMIVTKSSGIDVDDVPASFFESNENASNIFFDCKKVKEKYKEINKDLFLEEYPQHKDYLKQSSENLKSKVKNDINKYIFLKSVELNSKKIAEMMSSNEVSKINHEDVYNYLKKAMNSYNKIGENLDELSYFEDINNRFLKTESVFGVPTGVCGLDKFLFGGGLCAGELGIILALPNHGKSGSLINFATSAVGYLKKVLYISLEMSHELIAHRIDMRISLMNTQSVFENIGTVCRRIKEFKEATDGKLIIKRFPTGQATVSKISAYIEKLRIRNNFIPDIIFVDYADLLKPEKYTGEKRLATGAIYEDLRGLAVTYNVPIWTATQGNRSSMEADVLDMRSMAEDFSKNFTADVVISANFPKTEKNILNFYLAKNRNGTARIIVKCYYDWSRMLLTDYAGSGIYMNEEPFPLGEG